MSIPGDPVDQDEDCLFLNVWTPAPDGRRRPVMVWIHGGGFTAGTGSSLIYRGEKLSRLGDVVVVTINYRLGALGFLAHPSLATGSNGSLGAGTTGNWGLMDQVAALRWVRDNIAAFGGDPEQVTLFGESAGGMSISALLVAPSARGLFCRAIVQSGPAYVHSPERAVAAAEDLAELLALGEISREALESVPVADLVEAGRRLQGRLPRPGDLPLPFLPVVDGNFLPVDPEDGLAAGEAAGVSLMIGTNRDEITFFVMADPRIASLDLDGVASWFRHAAPGADPESILGGYRAAREARGEPATPRDLWVAAGSDLVFRWPSLRMAGAHAPHGKGTYVYLFTWETSAFGGMLGACHALEVPFVFGAVREPPIAAFIGADEHSDALAAQMQHAWLSFARTGDPSHDGIGNWPTWDPERRATMVFGPGGGVVDGPGGEEIDTWNDSEVRP
jgi:para-nitrobenzyl esterase